ncbi:MAG: SEC-C domain-containing protein [Candidatus Scalindua sp.]|nr:SEC-C domain-containing protein [Candidatus Scalindua sp.]
MKLGRNSPCWCGSQRKYKKCHLDRDKDEPNKPWEFIKSIKKSFSKKYCYAADCHKGQCKGGIVKAHTVSISSLKRIAQNGHIYAFKVESFKNRSQHDGLLPPELLGINKASVFNGFCEYHDNELFKPLEDKPFIGDKEQCFLLAYRAQAREGFLKFCQADTLDFLRESDKGRSVEDQFDIQARHLNYSEAVIAGIRDAKYYKEKFDKILMAKDYSQIKAYIIYFQKTPSVLCSAGIFPECDFHGNALQNIFNLDKTNELITFSSISTDSGGGVVIFSWVEDNDSMGMCSKFIESLSNIPHCSITNSLIRFFFEFCDNVFMTPSWWEGLHQKEKQDLIYRYASCASLFSYRSMDRLKDDGAFFDDWGFKESRVIS